MGYHYTCRRYSPEALSLFGSSLTGSTFFFTTCAAGIVPTELTWRMRGIRVYPKSSHTQFFDCVLGEPEVAMCSLPCADCDGDACGFLGRGLLKRRTLPCYKTAPPSTRFLLLHRTSYDDRVYSSLHLHHPSVVANRYC
jgi:hypothetical protein